MQVVVAGRSYHLVEIPSAIMIAEGLGFLQVSRKHVHHMGLAAMLSVIGHTYFHCKVRG